MFCILPFRIDFNVLKAYKSNVANTIAVIVRSLILLAVGFKGSRTFEKIFENNEDDEILSYIGLASIVLMQIFSFQVIFVQIFQTQILIDLFNEFFQNIKNVLKLTKGKGTRQKQVVYLFLLKVITTNLEIVLDLPLIKEYVERRSYKELLLWFLGWFLRIGNALLLNVCSIGFLVTAALIATLATYLNSMIRELLTLNQEKLSKYQEMNRLMYLADKLEETLKIYSNLHVTVHKFNEIMRHQILFALVYYLSGAIIILHITYTNYLTKKTVYWSPVIIGINMLIDSFALIISIDLVGRKAAVPAKLNLDILCSDLDERWDKCAEFYFSTMKLLEMKFEMRGLFQINYELILIILSGFVSYFAVLVTIY